MYTHVDVEYAPPKRLNQWEGKEKQMPDWGPINDSKSGTYLRTYTSLQLLNGFPIQLEIKLKLRKVKLTIGKRGRPRNYRVGLRFDSQVGYILTIILATLLYIRCHMARTAGQCGGGRPFTWQTPCSTNKCNTTEGLLRTYIYCGCIHTYLQSK